MISELAFMKYFNLFFLEIISTFGKTCSVADIIVESKKSIQLYVFYNVKLIISVINNSNFNNGDLQLDRRLCITLIL